MMALSPVAYIPPGCSQYCTRNVITKPATQTFAYSSDKCISLYTKVSHSVPKFTKSSVIEELNNNAAGNGNNNNNTAGANASTLDPSKINNITNSSNLILTKGGVLTVPSYALSCVYGDGVRGDIIGFDYNDECMACITAQSHEVYLWKLSNAEPIAENKIPRTLTSTFAQEGKASVMTLVGKHHIVFGTTHGKLISLNTHDHHEPRVVAIPFDTNNNSNTNNTVTESSTNATTSANNNLTPLRAPSTSQLLSGNTTSLSSNVPEAKPAGLGLASLPVPSLLSGNQVMNVNAPFGSTSSQQMQREEQELLLQKSSPSLLASALPNNEMASTTPFDNSLCVESISVSPLRADAIAAGTQNGLLVLCSLSASSGIRITSTLQPFQTPSKNEVNATFPTPNTNGSKRSSSVSMMNNSRNAVTSTQSEVHPISLICFSPHTSQHLLVGSSRGAIALCDYNTNSIITQFDYKECNKLRGIAWSVEENEIFYTINGESNKIDKWNINSSQKLISFAAVPDSCVIVSLSFIEKDRLVLTLQDGSVRVINITQQQQQQEKSSLTDHNNNSDNSSSNNILCQTEFTTLCNHTGTIRHCIFSKHDKDLIATAGSNNNINIINNANCVKVWNLRTMKLLYAINVGDVIITALAWSLNGKYLAVGLRSGEMVLYHCALQKEVGRHLLFASATSQLLWSTMESNVLIAASYTSGIALLNVKDNRLIRRLAPPTITSSITSSSFAIMRQTTNVITDPIVCMDVEPLRGKQIAIGCQSGKIHLYNMHTNEESPVLSWSTYGNAVTALSYCPVANQFLLVGSADGVVRLYDVSLREPRLVTSHVREFYTNNNNNNNNENNNAISCVAWCSIAPYLFLSSSGNGVIHVWDVRNNLCVASVRGHTSQICCLTSHEERPLIFVSSGVDGAIVAWSMTLLRQVYLDAAMGVLEKSFVADAAVLLDTNRASHEHFQFSITGSAVERLFHELREITDNNINNNTNNSSNKTVTTGMVTRVEKLISFFDFPCGAMDLSSLVSYANNSKNFATSATSENAKGLIYPTSKLTELYKDKVKQLNEKAHGKTIASSGTETKTMKLIQVAEEMLKVGQYEESCQLLMEAKEYDKALALAPMVSLPYWKELCKRVASLLEHDGNERAIQYYVACEESVKAAQLLARLSPESVNEAIVLCETCAQNASSTTGTPSPEQTEENTSLLNSSSKRRSKEKESRRSGSLRQEVVPIIPPVPMATSLNLPRNELTGLTQTLNTNVTNTSTSLESKNKDNVNEGNVKKEEITNASNRKRSSDVKALSHTKKTLLLQRASTLAQSGPLYVRLFAAALLSAGANDNAVQMLLNGGDVVLSHLLIDAIPMRSQATIDHTYWQAMLHSAHMHKWESALLCAVRYSNPYHTLATLCAYYQYAHVKLSNTTKEKEEEEEQGEEKEQNEQQQQRHTKNAITKAARIKANNDKVITFTNLIKQECNKLQLPLDAASIQQRHASDGLASQNQLAAMTITMDLSNPSSLLSSSNSISNTPIMTSSVLLQSVNGFMENLLSAAMQDLDSVNAQFYLRQALNVSSYVSLPVISIHKNNTKEDNNINNKLSIETNITTSNNTSNTNKLSAEHRKFLALALTTAALFCVKIYRFPKLLNPSFTKAREMAQDHSSVEALLTKLQTQLATYSPHSVEVDCTCTGAHILALDSNGKLFTSMLTNEPIQGALFMLDDGMSYASREEML